MHCMFDWTCEKQLMKPQKKKTQPETLTQILCTLPTGGSSKQSAKQTAQMARMGQLGQAEGAAASQHASRALGAREVEVQAEAGERGEGEGDNRT